MQQENWSEYLIFSKKRQDKDHHPALSAKNIMTMLDETFEKELTAHKNQPLKRPERIIG